MFRVFRVLHIDSMVVTFSDFHFIMGWLNVAALPNIDFMVVTLLVFQFPIVCVSCLIPLNHFHVSGFYQNDIRQTKCVECASGESYVDAKTACRACDIGTFESSKGICETCPTGFYQDSKSEKECCNTCSASAKISNSKGTRCELPPWGACEVGEYLHNTDQHNNAWQCIACPNGADCTTIDPTTSLMNIVVDVHHR